MCAVCRLGISIASFAVRRAKTSRTCPQIKARPWLALWASAKEKESTAPRGHPSGHTPAINSSTSLAFILTMSRDLENSLSISSTFPRIRHVKCLTFSPLQRWRYQKRCRRRAEVNSAVKFRAIPTWKRTLAPIRSSFSWTYVVKRTKRKNSTAKEEKGYVVWHVVCTMHARVFLQREESECHRSAKVENWTIWMAEGVSKTSTNFVLKLTRMPAVFSTANLTIRSVKL